MTAQPSTIHGFDLHVALATLTRGRGPTDVDVIVDELLAMIQPSEYERVLREALADVVVRAHLARPTPKPRPRPTPAGPAAKVATIRDQWQHTLAAFDFTGHRGRPTTLLDATSADLLAAARDRADASQLAARQAAFLRGVAKALDDAGVQRVEQLPAQLQRAVAERIPT